MLNYDDIQPFVHPRKYERLDPKHEGLEDVCPVEKGCFSGSKYFFLGDAFPSLNGVFLPWVFSLPGRVEGKAIFREEKFWGEFCIIFLRLQKLGGACH